MIITEKDWEWATAALDAYEQLELVAKEIYAACPHAESPRVKRLAEALRGIETVHPPIAMRNLWRGKSVESPVKLDVTR